MQVINELKQTFASASLPELPQLIKAFEQDTRQGVKKLVASYQRKYEEYLKEQDRLIVINKYETEYYSKGILSLAGIDEVGRGPLAGPVMACAIILPQNSMIPGVNDSKKLSEKKRESLSKIIKAHAISIGFGMVDAKTIDEIGISNATHRAMAEALENLEQKAEFALVDGYEVPGLPVAQKAIIGGDSKSISIAAASIVAKVTRDDIMRKYHEIYPEYEFISNKGYGSGKHIEAIKANGLSPIHRRSFTRHFVV